MDLRARSLVGRDEELAHLGQALVRARAGEAGAVVVAGEPGVGKSALCAALVRSAQEAGDRVLTGGCVELSGGGLPYGPLRQALQDLVDELGPAAVTGLLGAAAADLGTLVPELGEPVAPGDGAAGRARLFDAVRRLLAGLARDRPVLLVVEDLHWADASTVDLLAVLLRGLRRARLLTLLTCRPEELPAATRGMLAELERSRTAAVLDVGRLEPAAVRALLEQRAGPGLPGPVTDRLARLSEGNPFFAEELLAAGTGCGDGALPARLRALLLARVAGLPAPAREALATAAVCGVQAGHDVLAPASGLGEAELLQGLRDAVAAGLLTADPGAHAYRFRHALTREAVYEDLLPGERARRHGAVARVLQERGARTLERASELAHHWQRAGVPREALPSALQAARLASDAYATPEAHLLHERVLRLWDEVADPEALTGTDRVGLLGEAAEAARWDGRPDRALELARAAVAGVDRQADPVRAATALERVGRHLWESADTQGCLAAYAEGAALLDALPPSPAHARLLAAQASALAGTGRYSAARALADRAVAVARGAGARAEEGWARCTLGVALALTGEAEGGLAALAAARRLAAEAGTLEDVLRAAANSAVVLEAAGRAGEALDVALAGLATARAARVELTGGSVLLTNAVALLFSLGRWDEAEATARDALERGMAPGLGVFLRLTLAEVDLARDRPAQAAAGLEQVRRAAAGLDEPQLVAPLHAALAELAAGQGRHAQAGQHVDEGLAALGDAEDDQLALRLCALGLRVVVDGPAPDRGRADALLARARGLAAGLTPGGDPEARAEAATAEAEHARLSGTADPAAWERVVRAWDDLGRAGPAAYAQGRRAEALLAARQAREGAAALTDALARADALGAAALRRELRALAARTRLRLPAAGGPAPAAPAPSPYGLTPRERDVLAHLVRGSTNRQIARAMFITEKTASVHVSNILAKLGVANRGGAAALAVRLRLVPEADASSPEA